MAAIFQQPSQKACSSPLSAFRGTPCAGRARPKHVAILDSSRPAASVATGRARSSYRARRASCLESVSKPVPRGPAATSRTTVLVKKSYSRLTAARHPFGQGARTRKRLPWARAHGQGSSPVRCQPTDLTWSWRSIASRPRAPRGRRRATAARARPSMQCAMSRRSVSYVARGAPAVTGASGDSYGRGRAGEGPAFGR